MFKTGQYRKGTGRKYYGRQKTVLKRMAIMKKALSTLLIVCILAATCACNNGGAEISSIISAEDPVVDNSNSMHVSEGDGGVEEPSRPVDPNRFYEARAVPEYGNYTYGHSAWSSNGSFLFQDLNTVNVIDRNNTLLKTITLDESKLPPAYILTWSDDWILAIRKYDDNNPYEYGAVYLADGKINLCGVSVWDMDGKLVKEYPSFPLGFDDFPEDGEERVLTNPEGVAVDWSNGLYDGILVYWLDNHTIAINGHNRVILYDLDSDTGRVVDDMAEMIDKYGKFSVYYGVDYNFCYVYNGDFYYLSHREDEKANTSGTIWRVGKDDTEASVMFEGKDFTHLYMDDSRMILTQTVDEPEYGYNLWWADARQGILNEMGFYKTNIPIMIDEQRVSMRSDTPELYCYDMEQQGESALTVFEPGASGARDLFGTRLSSDGSLQFVCSEFHDDEELPISFYALNAEDGEKICIYEGYLYDKLLLSPDKSCGVVFSSGESEDLPQVRIILLK